MANKEKLALTAERIKAVRESLGLSMQAFAERIDDGAVQGTVGNWEAGLNRPNLQRTKKIAELGNVSVAYLRGEEDDLLANAAQYTAHERSIDEAYETLGKIMVAAASGADVAKLEAIAATIQKAADEIHNL